MESQKTVNALQSLNNDKDKEMDVASAQKALQQISNSAVIQ